MNKQAATGTADRIVSLLQGLADTNSQPTTHVLRLKGTTGGSSIRFTSRRDAIAYRDEVNPGRVARGLRPFVIQAA